MSGKFFFGMLLFFPVAVVVHFFTGSSSAWVFVFSALAIIPLAKFIGEATEELAGRTDVALGSLINATFGNATEFIIGIFALSAGLTDVVKASITGSIIGNLLFVLGTAMFFGGLNRRKQTFNITAIQAVGSTLLVAVIALIIPAVFVLTAPASSHVETLSVLVAIFLILTYIASLFFSLRTHKHLYAEDIAKFEPKWSVAKSILVLLIATLAVSWMSDLLIGSIQPVVAQFGWTELFIGAVVFAIIGNIAEHFSAISIARKNRMDLAVQIAVGSATQVATLIAPLLVIISLFFSQQMNLVFGTFELVAILFTVFIVNAVIMDGESNWFEGLQLIVAYIIIALSFYFHP